MDDDDLNGHNGRCWETVEKVHKRKVFANISDFFKSGMFTKICRNVKKNAESNFCLFFSRSQRKKLIFESETGGTMLQLLIAAPVIEKYEHQDLRRKS